MFTFLHARENLQPQVDKRDLLENVPHWMCTRLVTCTVPGESALPHYIVLHCCHEKGSPLVLGGE